MKKFSTAFITCLLGILLFAEIISAHVVVYPQEVTQGSYEKFSIRVPSESESPTIKVEVKFPEEVSISRFEPKAGWSYEPTKDASGKIVGVVWKATGEGLLANEFTEFNMSGKVGENATNISWKSYQTYKDGKVVEWTGAADSNTPASLTKVTAKVAGGGTDSHGHPSTAVDTGTSSSHEANDSGAEYVGFTVTLYLSIAALILGIIAIIIALTRK
ncbi:YcnI family copper-binding membrane protein [Brevibacillus daliensis]|uniref:YcnI family copper-binding membrane protein n=1 Tax=Brevibacillus daliensis TaxID=2892995 RepID=UPI001E3A995C|nr:YcnI family protein [Brevibacillus daliensis]